MTVAIKKIDSDIMKAVSDVMDAACFKDFIARGEKVFIKVNLGWDLFVPGSVTNPGVFEGVVRKLKGYAGKIYVVESNQVLENIEKAYKKSKICTIAREMDVEWINLSKMPKFLKSIPGNRVLKQVKLAEILSQGAIITLPVMKTHNKTTVTLSLKNQWGCIPKMRHMYHLVLDEAISDVNAAIGVRFAVVDGTIAMEGNAPKTGIPREVNIVGAGGDLVAVDSVFASLMGFDPQSISHLKEAERRGLGKIAKAYTGDQIEPLKPFREAKHNIVSRIEMLLRTSLLSTVVFKTPLFILMLLGAKIYYYFWELFKGKALRKKYREHPIYGRYY